MLPGLLALLLVAAPDHGPVKLAAPGFSVLNVSAEAGSYFSDHFAQQLESPSMRVTSSSEIGTLIGLERQKQLLGCTENSTSCIAELANALGVDGIVRGSVGRFGDSFQVNVKVLSAKDATTLAKFSSSVDGEKAVVGELTRAARELRAQVFAVLRPGLAEAPVEVTAPASSGPLRSYSWVPATAGCVVGGVGAYFLISAESRATSLKEKNALVVGSDPAGFARTAYEERTTGVVLVAVGAAAIAAGALMFGLGGTSVSPTVALTPGGGFVGIAGVLP